MRRPKTNVPGREPGTLRNTTQLNCAPSIAPMLVTPQEHRRSIYVSSLLRCLREIPRDQWQSEWIEQAAREKAASGNETFVFQAGTRGPIVTVHHPAAPVPTHVVVRAFQRQDA